MFEIHKSKNGQSYFVLKAKNGKVVATSQMYKSEQALYKGITSVRDNAESEIKDLR